MSEEYNIHKLNQLGRPSNQKCYQLRDNMQQNNEPNRKEGNEVRRVPPNLDLAHNENPQPSKVNRKKKKGVFNLPSKEKTTVPGRNHNERILPIDFINDAQQFNLSQSVDNNPSDIEMSLLEAFDTRFKLEQSILKSILPDKSDTTKKSEQSVSDTRRPQPVASDEALEEVVRAPEIPDNLQDYIRTHPGSDPLRAISCLSRAQRREKILQNIAKSLGCDK